MDPRTAPQWDASRATYPSHFTHGGLALSTSTEHAQPADRSMTPFIIALLGFLMAFVGTLAWRRVVVEQSHAAAMVVDESSAAGTAAASSLPVEAPTSASSSAFEPPPATLALPAPVEEPPVVVPVKVRHAAKGDGAHHKPKAIRAAAEPHAEGSTPRKLVKHRRAAD